MGQLNHEPSMEDILASIKRIIAEDSEAVGAKTPRMRREALAAVPAAPAPAPEAEAAPVEETVDEAPHTEATHEPVEAPVEAEPESLAPVAELVETEVDDLPDVLELTSPMPEPEPLSVAAVQAAPAAPSPVSTPPVSTSQPAEGLVSSAAAQASRSAFAALGQMQVRAEEGAPNTLDGLVADLLRPMLREWLDQNLPAMVERLVSAEVERLSGRG